jgi:hypothetical protein
MSLEKSRCGDLSSATSSAARPPVPGKRALTASLPPKQARAQAQNRAPTGADACTATGADASAIAAEDLAAPDTVAAGVASAMRPDLFLEDGPPPIQRKAAGNASAREPHNVPFAMHLIGQPVQRQAAGADDSEHTQAVAARGVRGPGAALPFLAQIQASFGAQHDLSQVKAHVGGTAAEASAEIGARAYATGNRVAFAGAPDLHTAAHEAAHVVQQRGGVSLKGGVGEAGDVYERHADAVADAVVAGGSAEALLAAMAGTGGGAPTVQRMKLVPDKGGPKLRTAKPKEKATIDTAELGPSALQVLLGQIEQYDPRLAGAIRKETQGTASPLELDDLAKVFELEPELAALEKAKQQHPTGAVDSSRAKKLAGQLSAAHVLLQSVDIPDEAMLYRDTIGAYARRLHALDATIKLDYKGGGGGLAVDINITPQDRLDYKADIQVDGVWGGLAEAEVAALQIHRRIVIFRIDQTGSYRRVTTIGAGRAASHHLLHLGNHYVAIPAAIVDGQLVAALDGRVETEPDGNCMYEAIQICLRGNKPTAEQRARFIAGIRGRVATNITDDAVDTSIVAMLAQGDRAGLGPKMQGLVKDKQDDARVAELDDKSLSRALARFEGIKEKGDLDYQPCADAYLAARKLDDSSDDTKAKLAALEKALAAAEMMLAAQTHAVNPSQIELSMDWFGAVKAAVGDQVLAKDNVFATLATQVTAFNQASRSAQVTIKDRLGAIDAIEEAFKNLEAPKGTLDVEDAAHERARIAVYGFQSVELRQIRANLIGLYQLTEGSRYRTGGPGGRPEMHYDVYAEGEDVGRGQRLTPRLEGMTKAEGQLVSREFKPTSPKDSQEALSAVALNRAYPELFGKIAKAPKYKSIHHNVEYYDDEGRPWDQVAGHSYTKGESDVGSAISRAVKDHLDTKPYPPKGTKENQADKAKLLPCGVILDCTYLDRNDYIRMWAHMIQTIPADDLRARVVEINVPFASTDKKADYSKGKAAPSNTTVLDSCRGKVEGDEDGIIYAIDLEKLKTHLPTIVADLQAIRDGKGNGNGDHPVYRNHGGFLPNRGSYFLEYYVNCGSLPVGTDVRIVYDRPNEIAYLTGTHYRPFMSPYSSAMRNPFYRLA